MAGIGLSGMPMAGQKNPDKILIKKGTKKVPFLKHSDQKHSDQKFSDLKFSNQKHSDQKSLNIRSF